MQGEIPKQRGIYSEILTTEDTENLKLASTIGPSSNNVIHSNVRQKVPRALGIKRKVEQAQLDKSQSPEGKVKPMLDKTGKIIGKTYFRDPEVNLGFYSKKREGVADVDPKVMEPFVPIPGKPPRKVVIDRQRKLFASLDIESLLLELHGIDYKNPTKQQSDWLPLEPFDDTEYDCRLPEEWIEYGFDENRNFNPIPGKGLWRDYEGKGYWRPVLINNYDSDRRVFSGFWDGTEEYCELTRINLLFNAEDPRIFAQRVAQAHQERIYADSQIRYNYFIDNMPTAELPELDSEQVSRIVSMATAAKFLQKKQIDHNAILGEVNLDFFRTMNLIIMEKNIAKSIEQLKDMIPHNLTMPPQPPPKEVPFFGMVPIPQHDFPEQFSNFCFHSLYIKEEVIKAMVEIRAECNQLLLDNKIFDVSIKTTQRLEEFKQKQQGSISQVKFNTRESGWVMRLEKIIKASFTDVGKGWFNIHETSKETYEFGKLKKFLTLVNFMMQDGVLTMCKDSVKLFVDFLLSFIPIETKIESTSSVLNRFEKIVTDDPEEDELKNKDPEPLFVLDLVLKANQIIPSFSTEPKEIVKTVLAIFDEGIKVLQEIPQLEPILLKHLFKTHGKKMLKAPLRPPTKPKPADPNNKRNLPDENIWLWEAYDAIERNLEQSIKPLYDYIQTFQQFEGENKLNPDRYVRSKDEGDVPITAEALKEDIRVHREEEQRLKNEIPETILVSIFQVNCKDIRNLYVGKHTSIVEKEIKLIAQKAKEQNYQLTTKFDEINERIRRPPKNIEELTDTKRYIMEIPIEIEKQKQNINQCMDVYAILDEFNYEFSASDQDQKWYLFGAPKRVIEIIETQSQILEKQKEAFVKAMEAEQVDFEDSLDNLAQTIATFSSFEDMNKYEETAANAETVNQRLQECIDQARLFNQREFLVGKDQKDYTRLQQMNKDFLPYSNLWLTTRNWFKSHQGWMTDPWEKLNAMELENTFDNSNKTMAGVLRYFRDKELPKILAIATSMKAKIDEFKPYVPLAVSLRKDGMKERHWDAISARVGFDIRPTMVENFTLTTVIEKGMLKYVDICEEIGEKAQKEYYIELNLTKMQNDWKNVDFNLPQFKATTTNFIAGFDDAMAMLDEHIVTTQAMTFSPFKKPFEAEIEEWNKKLMLVSDTLEEWVKCQGQWMYLQPIFDSPDIMKQLPQETKRFKSVDSTWRHIINQTKQAPSILQTCSKEGLKEKFQEANKNLEIVQKGLSDYLEKKRSIFARFYFLSNDELLEILSQTKEVRNVRPHLRKVFENMQDLEFRDDDTIWAMFSGEGEKVNFVKKIDPKDRNVEFWMGDVEKMMTMSVRHVLKMSIDDYVVRPRNQWIVSHPGQCILNGSQVCWTNDVETAIRLEGALGIKKYLEAQKQQLNDTVTLVRSKLSKMATITINALIVIDVHAKDVIAKLAEEGVSDVNAFEWISQLRYYWENDDCYVKCVQTNFPYGYEYLGNTLRLVITPLTDKCYMTLMGALNLNLGGAPAGPAGTGKTESTKDLAKALAKQCVVFNCSDGMDHIMVAKFFKGLASAGAWACFDEFNRINIEVLSVIAQQLLQLFGAKAQGLAEITFEESLIKMKPTFCVFITMNPGYAGRTELPDNLKALFRPVAMMVPDYALIGEIMLYSFGFLTGRDLARKMVTTFKLSSEQLSSQDHYDYGMRAVRSVINAAGLLKRATPDMNEDQLLLRALRDVNVPKFLKDDLPLFENIILDLFPGIERPQVNYGNLLTQINKSCTVFNLQPQEVFVGKIVQLYDTIQVRHGLMIVGPTGGGKTSNYKILQHSMTALKGEDNFVRVHVDILNPKSITMGQLYGYVDPQTTEWQDGVLAKLVVDCTKDESPDLHWVMFDGPVDALWIENMNTVLDDNKKLCLNSGQIITLTSRMTMMFEVEDLAVASPATVSRCGMVYMEPASLTLFPLIPSWVNTVPPKVAESKQITSQLLHLFNTYISDACYFVRKNVVEPVKTVDNNLTQSTMRIIDCYLNKYKESEIKKISKDEIADLELMIKEIFVFALIWSVGTTTNLTGRMKFDKWFREKIKDIGIPFPEDKMIYDYKFNPETKEWQYWLETIPQYQVDTKMNYSDIVVPTVDSIRMKFMTRTLLLNDFHCLNPGPTGTGKSVNTQQLLTYELPEEFQTLAMTFSAQTSANQTQDYLDDKLEKRRKQVYGPPVGKKFVIFIDDLNMPKKEEFGAQPPLELLRQFMDHSGWYDRKSKEKPFNKIVDIIFVCAMGPPGGGRSEITQRLQRHFNIMTYTDLQMESIRTIFLTIITAFLSTFTIDIRNALEPLVEMTLRVYDQVLNGPLKPTPNKSHYTFNLRDISRIFQGLCNAYQKQTTLPLHLVRLWIHENKRVFADRLIDNIDRDWLDSQLLTESEQTYNLKKEEIYNSERIIFCDFMGGIDVEVRNYIQVNDLKEFVNKIDEYLQDYNTAVKTPMKLVMFLDACDHAPRIERIIRQPLGNSLLLGVGGSGRQSLSRLATYLANYKIFQIEVVKGYSMSNWREDVKRALLQAGIENKSTSFLFVDTQIINEQMLEDINNILNSGDVPNLYKTEDLENIFQVGKQECMAKNIAVTKMNMFQGYVGRVRKNIHMIIAMSPLGEIFRSRLRKFPSLVNNCTIDWFNEWPEEALLGVGRGAVDGSEDLHLGKFLGGCVEMFKEIHQSVEKISVKFLAELRKRNYVTPTSFLELLNMYKKILQDKRKEIEFQKNRLSQGLRVLGEAAVEIAKLKENIDKMTPELEITKRDVEKTMHQLSHDRAEADEEKEIVARDEAEATQQEAEVQVMKAEAEEQLKSAVPLLEEAARILNSLKVDDFVFLGSIKVPSPTIIVGMEVACIMLGHKPKKINIGKYPNDNNGFFDMARVNLLNNPKQFMQSLVNYDKENIPDNVVKRVNAILEGDDFTLEKAENAARALIAIQKWSKAMMTYHELLKIVNPKRIKVAEMRDKLAIVRANLAEKRKRLKEVEEKIETLERMFREKKELEQSLQQQIDDCMKKLDRASKIIIGLEGEKVRWTETVGRLDKEYGLLIGNCLIAAGTVAYSGAFTAQYRGELENIWRQKIKNLSIIFYEQTSMKTLLEDPVKTKIWTAATLPNDNLSIENAIIMFRSRRWPLMIDPQNQANKFVKNLGKDEAESGLEVFKSSDANFLRNLELGIQFGKWVLMENVGEELDPALEPILLKQVDKSGSLRLGDKSIPYSNAFKFFMTTSLPNPHYSPETSVKVTILNFAITPFGLEEQMLNQFVSQEMPELQKKKDTIVQQNAQSAKALREIEDKILEGLTKNSQIAMILEDDELIKILDESKKTSEEISNRMKESELTEKEIDKTREIFRPVAYRAAILFFTIIDLAMIDPMYQYSLQWFANLFGNSVDNSAKSNDPNHRITNLNDYFTLNLYENVCRSLFERHKLLFSFMLAVKILMGNKEMDADEWRYYLAGPSGEIEIFKNPTDWLGDLEWAEVYKQLFGLAKLPLYHGFDEFFIKNHKKFQEIFDSKDPQNMPLPGEWNKKLNSFQKMLVLKAIRPDKITLAVQNFIVEKIGKDFIIPPTFNLAKSFKDSSVTIPLIFVLSTGSDPVADLIKFAEEMNMSKKLDSISLGRGQDKKAERMIEDAATRGGWVLLMNCHLAISFSPKLEMIVENLDDSNHRDFRLWLTSMPTKEFPVSTLQNSVKMTLEPPSGLRLNLLRTFQNIDNKDLNESTTKPDAYKKLLFGLCFFHAIVQDRRQFGPIGWNIPYEFTNEDLYVSKRQLRIFVQDYEEVPYKVLNYIGAEINYGGRVTDDKDCRLIQTILRTYITPGIFEDGFKFSTSGTYYSPPVGEQEDYIEYIKSLPLNPHPEAFGLHENAQITTYQNDTRILLENILLMQPRASSGAGKSREQIIGEMAAYIQTRTPEAFDLEEVGKMYPTSYEESNNTVLFQECVRYNRLLVEMKISLVNVQKALKGEVVMSEELEKMSDSIFNNQVPKMWQEKGFLSLKPLASWIQDLNDRVNFLTQWIKHGTPSVFWISGFFFPQAFLTGTLQNFSRKKYIAIDRLAFDFIIKDNMTYKDVRAKPDDGCYIYGMYIEGCKWDFRSHQLGDSEAKKLFTDLPLMHLVPKPDRVTPKTGIYNCPVYKVLSRSGTLSTTGHSTNFVQMLELPTDQTQDTWIKAGVACFLALRY